MLSKYYNLIAVNNTGYVQTYNSGARTSVRIQPWKISTAGVLTYGTVATDDFGFGAGETIANAGRVELSAKIDNSVNLNFGAIITFEVTTDNASTAGTFSLFLETCDVNAEDPSTDAIWPSNQPNFDPTEDCIFLGAITLAGAETKAKNFEI